MKLKEYRLASKYNLSEFGKLVGVKRDMVRAYEHGREILTLKTALQWSDTLGCKLEAIYDQNEQILLYRKR